MTHPTDAVWTEAEALFASCLSWTEALSGAVPSAVPTTVAWGIGATAAVVLVGLAVGAHASARPGRVSPTLPVLMTRSLLVLAALLTAAPAFAQSHADPMARLAAFEGTYTLDGTPHMAPEGSFDGTLTIAPTLGGHFQQWDWEMTMRESGHADETVYLRFIVGYDPSTHAYTIHRFDSRDASSRTRSAGAFDAAAGRLQVDGAALVMAWSSASADEPARTGTFRNRVRLTDGGLHVETEGVRDDGSPVVAIATTRAARR